MLQRTPLSRFEEIADFFKTRKGRRYIKVSTAFLLVSVIVFVSLKVTNINYQREIEDLKNKIEAESRRLDSQRLKEEYIRYKEFLTLWESSRYQSEAIYDFLVLLSKAVSRNIQINKIEISLEDENSQFIDFALHGLAKNGDSIRTFASRLNKKRGKLLVRADITEISKGENELFVFKISGIFGLNPKKKKSGKEG